MIRIFSVSGNIFCGPGFFKIIGYVFIILSLNSCFVPEEEIQWDVKSHPPMLVVNGTITNEMKRHGIRLSVSGNYFAREHSGVVHGASVRVSEGSNNYIFTEDTSGWYFSNEAFAGETGKTYTLLVTLSDQLNGQKEYTASSTMPQGINIDSISCEIYALPEIYREATGKDKDTAILFVVYYGFEPPNTGNYYYAKMYRNNDPLFSNVKDYPFVDDSERNGSYVNATAVIKNVLADDIITFELFSTDKKFYNYIDGISKIDFTGNIYSPSGPPANATGNIEGALGFFNVTYTSKKTSVAIDRRR